VNAIAPALIETDTVTSHPNASPALIPMGHFGSVDDAQVTAEPHPARLLAVPLGLTGW
jgi:hypothetical protein